MNQNFERYELLKKIGEGGMGVVYLARDNQTGKIVALKVLQSNLISNEHVLQRFKQEAHVMEKLQHPNIVQLLSTAQSDGQFALVMEYIEGRTLDTMIGREVGPIPHERALPIFNQILDGIQYAHEQGIIHRDIKPSNIMITINDEIKIMDFGIAKLAGSKGMTKTGMKLGTLYYMSPEQVMGKAVDERSDIYSLGMTLYEMLSGTMPLEDDSSSEFVIMEKIIKEPMPDPRGFYPHIPAAIVDELFSAIEKDASKRHQSCAEFKVRLNDALDKTGKESQNDLRIEKYKLLEIIRKAESGDATAQYHLGWMYEQGCGVPQDDVQAVHWYKKAAEQGEADAQNNLGWMYADGRGVPQDDTQAVFWYRKAAEQGNADAQNNFGRMYENGVGVPQDDKKAVHWYRKAAEHRDVWAQFNLGRMYANGRGVPQDDKKAVDWYKKAAEQRDADGQNNLGWKYANGVGVPQDDAQAVDWYRKAAEQGNSDAQNHLGWMYEQGCGVPQDDTKAVDWYKKAAEQGYATAQNNLGRMYLDGRGVPQDDKKAVFWYRKAAEQGDTTAQYNLGVMYDEGCGVPQDDTQAVFWYRKAAEQGNADAQNNLGVMYDEGRGVPQDDTQAVFWYRKAAEQGDATAQFNLGWMYAKGRGVPQDDAQAVYWFRKAAEQGDADAKKQLKKLNKSGCMLTTLLMVVSVMSFILYLTP